MSIEAMKQALEYLQDNQHYIADNERHAYVMEYNAFIERFKKAIEQAQKQEPVAHWCTYCQGFNTNLCQFNTNKVWPKTYTTNHTSPPQRQPLTDEQIAEMWQQYNPLHGIASFARAVEAAHGIKGEA